MKTLAALVLLAGCQFSPPMTPSAAEEGTYELYDSEGQGTAWALDEHHMMTAGHMCTDGVGQHLTARTADRFQFAVEIVDYDLTDYDLAGSELKDVCLLYSERPLPHPLPLASEMPEVGTEAWFVGYPRNTLVKSIGKYEGDIDGNEPWDNFTVSAPSDHGASGSAAFTDAGVFGILVRGLVIGDQVRFDGFAASPLSQIQDLLKRNGIPFPTK